MYDQSITDQVLRAALINDLYTAHRRLVSGSAIEAATNDQDSLVLALLDVLQERGAFDHDDGLRDALLEAAHDVVGFDYASADLGQAAAAVAEAEAIVASLAARESGPLSVTDILAYDDNQGC